LDKPALKHNYLLFKTHKQSSLKYFTYIGMAEQGSEVFAS